MALSLRSFSSRFKWCCWLALGFLAFIYLALYAPVVSVVWNKTVLVRRFYIKDGYNSAASCTRKQNITFLKTHKCASSTVQNILLRYAHFRNLTVVLPVMRNTHYLSRLIPFSRAMVSGAAWGKNGYNILCHHMIFNQTEVELLMPNDTVYVTIVRDPVSLFESLYEYDNMADSYKMDIEAYAAATQNQSLRRRLLKRAGGNLGKNQMLFDLGVPQSSFENESLVLEAIDKIDKRFDLVMVAEFFDESIVFLKHLMCWDLDDVISFTVNARMKTFKRNLSEEATVLLQRWNAGDHLLYNHFLKRLRAQIADFGVERMEEEVGQLRKRRMEWLNSCVDGEGEARNLTNFQVWSNKVLGFRLKSGANNSTCEDLVKPERLFTSELRQQQLVRTVLKRTKGNLPHNISSLTNLKDGIVFKHLEEMVRKDPRFRPLRPRGPVSLNRKTSRPHKRYHPKHRIKP